MSTDNGNDSDPARLAELADEALDATSLTGLQWLEQQLDAMYDSKRRLETELSALTAERDRMRSAGQVLIERMKKERALLRQWAERAKTAESVIADQKRELERLRQTVTALRKPERT